MPLRRARFLLIGLAAVLAPLIAAHAENELSAYVGAGIGRSQMDIDSQNASLHGTGWKAVVGVRALDFLGAEAEYVDLGRARVNTQYAQLDSRASGPAVFGLAYLPIPIPYLDVFGKAGIANIQQRATLQSNGGGSACLPGVGCDGFNRSESEFAWGGGVQVKVAKIAVRAEFEQYRASGGSLNLGSVGVFWTFP
jgi:opacity protein-like surface antigen